MRGGNVPVRQNCVFPVCGRGVSSAMYCAAINKLLGWAERAGAYRQRGDDVTWNTDMRCSVRCPFLVVPGMEFVQGQAKLDYCAAMCPDTFAVGVGGVKTQNKGRTVL